MMQTLATFFVVVCMSTTMLTRVTSVEIAVKVLVDAKGSSEAGPTPNPKAANVEILLKPALATSRKRIAYV
jgi:hypothetical protein